MTLPRSLCRDARRVALAAALAVVAATGCREPEKRSPVAPATPADRPNLLLVTVDTLPAGMTLVSCAITSPVTGDSCTGTAGSQTATATFAKVSAGQTRTFTVVARVATSLFLSLSTFVAHTSTGSSSL